MTVIMKKKEVLKPKSKPYKEYFKGKKITVMGLGLLGRGVGDVKFLASCGADLIVTDLKKAEDLKTSLNELEGFKNIKYTLGEHKLEDFRNRDFVLKAAGVPLDSPFIAEARKNNIPVEMSSSLFAKLSGAVIVGITGTRGKSTVTHLLHHILKKFYQGSKTKVFLGGNVKGVSTLSFLKQIKEGDIAVLELDSWQLQGFGDSRISPQVSIFTTFLPDHLNYYKDNLDAYLDDKANIFKFQKANDVLIFGRDCAGLIQKKYSSSIRGKIVVALPESLPVPWKIQIPGDHNRYNISIAIATAAALNIPMDDIKVGIETFKGVAGRLELRKKIRGVAIYNDTTATTPEATIAGLKAFRELSSSEGEIEKRVILIMGGADKNLDMSGLVSFLPVYCKKVIFLTGSGTEKIFDKVCALNIPKGVSKTESLKEALDLAMKDAERGNVVLFSPAFASFGMFKNEFDRGDRFNELVDKLK